MDYFISMCSLFHFNVLTISFQCAYWRGGLEVAGWSPASQFTLDLRHYSFNIVNSVEYHGVTQDSTELVFP